jgi:hypothetical protein
MSKVKIGSWNCYCSKEDSIPINVGYCPKCGNPLVKAVEPKPIIIKDVVASNINIFDHATQFYNEDF